MTPVGYTVKFEEVVTSSVTRRVEFDPEGMEVAEIIERAVSEAMAIDGGSSRLKNAVVVTTVDGEQIWAQASGRPPVQLAGASQVGAWFGVQGQTVSVWLTRYQQSHPVPVPDYVAGDEGYWLLAREQEWRDWEATRPGQGRGGGPKRSGPNLT